MNRLTNWFLLLIFLIVSIISIGGCNLPITPSNVSGGKLQEVIKNKLICDSTFEERELYSIIFANDKQVKGSIDWAYNEIGVGLEDYEDSIVSSEILVLFDYTQKQFPLHDSKEGVIISSVGYRLQSDIARNKGLKIVHSRPEEYPEWLCVARLINECGKIRHARLITTIQWLSQRKAIPIENIQQIVETFKWGNHKWSIEKIEHMTFTQQNTP